jgi:hypothetical protein
MLMFADVSNVDAFKPYDVWDFSIASSFFFIILFIVKTKYHHRFSFMHKLHILHINQRIYINFGKSWLLFNENEEKQHTKKNQQQIHVKTQK